MARKCIDISAWQGNVSKADWKKVRGSGIEYAILRTSYTSWDRFKLHEDKCFENNAKTAKEAKVLIGAYHYSQATSESEARREAEFCVSVIRKYEKKHGIIMSLPVAFDWEFGGRLSSSVARKLGKQRCKQICDTFCKVIRRYGYKPMIYANLSTLNGYIATDIYKYWSVWVAQYHSRCDYKHPYYMWQYSSSGSVPGLSGRIDMNYLYGQSAVSTPTKTERYMYELPKLPHRGWFTSGDKGDEVRKLQQFLNWYGDYGLKVDGEVGQKTIDAVKRYEGREGLKIDGNFGKECLKRAKAVRR